MKKTILLIVLIVIGLIYYTRTQQTQPTSNIPGDAVACTADAMMCPDGSYVGRSGPNCEFVCPSSGVVASSSNAILRLKKPTQIGSVTVTPLFVRNDSRCPSDVQCIQAGTVKVVFDVKSASGEKDIELEVGKSATAQSAQVTLVEVTPYPVSTHKITDDEYRFTVTVK